MFENAIVEVSFSEQGVEQTETRASLEERMAAYGAPGVCVTVVCDNEVAWTKGWGTLEAGAESPRPVMEDSVFQAGSVSKFVTALMVLKLVDAGTLDLDADINDYLRSWTMPDNEYGKPITLRLLLSHQSGIPGTNFAQDPDAPWPTLPQILSAEAPARNKPALPVAEPGAGWSYSNIGYVVIQLLLEDVLEKPFEDIARALVFEPANMRSSTFLYPLEEAQRVREAMPHAGGEAKEAVQDSHARAQGGLMTTTEDIARLVADVQAAYGGEAGHVLTPKSARAMLERQVALPIQAFGIPLDMGLGVLLEENGSSLSFLHPGQSYPGSAFLFVAFPETKQAVVLAVNGDKGDRLQLELLASLAQLHALPSGEYFKKPPIPTDDAKE